MLSSVGTRGYLLVVPVLYERGVFDLDGLWYAMCLAGDAVIESDGVERSVCGPYVGITGRW